MIKAIAHICIFAKDLDRTRTFYCTHLGLKKKFDFLRDGRVVGYYFQINEHNFIEVFQSDDAFPPESQIKHLCLQIDDIDKTIQALRQCGIDITDKKMGCDNSWQAWLTDPNGIKIELHEYTEKSGQITGTDCVVDF